MSQSLWKKFKNTIFLQFIGRDLKSAVTLPKESFNTWRGSTVQPEISFQKESSQYVNNNEL